jgi:hypothetical protein
MDGHSRKFGLGTTRAPRGIQRSKGSKVSFLVGSVFLAVALLTSACGTASSVKTASRQGTAKNGEQSPASLATGQQGPVHAILLAEHKLQKAPGELVTGTFSLVAPSGSSQGTSSSGGTLLGGAKLSTIQVGFRLESAPGRGLSDATIDVTGLPPMVTSLLGRSTLLVKVIRVKDIFYVRVPGLSHALGKISGLIAVFLHGMGSLGSQISSFGSKAAGKWIELGPGLLKAIPKTLPPSIMSMASKFLGINSGALAKLDGAGNSKELKAVASDAGGLPGQALLGLLSSVSSNVQVVHRPSRTADAEYLATVSLAKLASKLAAFIHPHLPASMKITASKLSSQISSGLSDVVAGTGFPVRLWLTPSGNLSQLSTNVALKGLPFNEVELDLRLSQLDAAPKISAPQPSSVVTP